jgi:hypothetical protein
MDLCTPLNYVGWRDGRAARGPARTLLARATLAARAKRLEFAAHCAEVFAEPEMQRHNPPTERDMVWLQVTYYQSYIFGALGGAYN